MRVVDEIHLDMPYAGARKISRELRRRTDGRIDVGKRATASLMEEMNVRILYPRPNLSKPAKAELKHPYLLKNKQIRFPNQVWSVDITYVPIGRAHMYLTCVIDWFSRYVVGWRLADDMGAAGVCSCVGAAMDEHGEPSILNSDVSAKSSACPEGSDCPPARQIRLPTTFQAVDWNLPRAFQASPGNCQ